MVSYYTRAPRRAKMCAVAAVEAFASLSLLSSFDFELSTFNSFPGVRLVGANWMPKIKLHAEPKLHGKPVSASRSEMTEIVLPAQTNPLGKLLGGQVMHLVDMVAAMAAHRHSASYVVTASVDYIDFRNPVNLGEIVTLTSQVNRVFHTSMEVGVEVYSENVLRGEKKHTTTAYVTFVALDENTGQPKPVAPLIVKTAEEKRRFREAAKRRKVRLALRYGKK